MTGSLRTSARAAQESTVRTASIMLITCRAETGLGRPPGRPFRVVSMLED